MRIFRKIPFTQEGYTKLQEELKKLKEMRPEAVDTLAKARALGDLSENGMYKAARGRLSSIDHRIERLTDLMKQADVKEPAGRGIVEIGRKVNISHKGKTLKIAIVGGYESNPSEGRISHLSPLGQALMKKKAGETVVVEAPTGKVKYKILSVE